MTEHTVKLFKETGGCTLTGPDGKQYTWPRDGSAVDVPYGWALELLAIPGGGFRAENIPPPARSFAGPAAGGVQTAEAAGLAGSEEGESLPPGAAGHAAGGVAGGEATDGEVTEPGDSAEVTEPAPEPARAVTEPAPRRARATPGHPPRAPSSATARVRAVSD